MSGKNQDTLGHARHKDNAYGSAYKAIPLTSLELLYMDHKRKILPYGIVTIVLA